MAEIQMFNVGQRWISNTEPNLGLGAILSVSGRTVDILFPATEEQRTYALDSAPLTRLTFEVGDVVRSAEGWDMAITDVIDTEGVIRYQGIREDTKEDASLHETGLDHHIRLNQPEKRLFSGQIDEPKWFDLRFDSLHYQHQHATSPTLGLAGARIDLIPHQLHIAAEVGKRYAPRVLLADEVGLGKTIEAALIIHQQIQTGRAQRVLIVVPDSLVHQWLVEMLRRVNLNFAVFDESRCEAIAEEQSNATGEEGEDSVKTASVNVFDSEQLVLCSLSFLTEHDEYRRQAIEAQWDLLIVDEAHHLQWQPQLPSPQYQAIEALAHATKGVLLLTATPDQLGHQSHFARLRLLDPARFHDYDEFLEEERHYGELADAVAPLLDYRIPDDEELTKLKAVAGEWLTAQTDFSQREAREALIDTLIDQHGTGRLLFRNRRAAIAGFPERHVHAHPQTLPESYQTLLHDDEIDTYIRLHPEQQPEVFDQWLSVDPRVNWLCDFVTEVRPEKILVICASAVTAQQLAEHIRVKTGIRQTVFHEGMSLVERDKAAHYFAQAEDGAQVLICSEIGSEGRNFQFANQLVLFDLPLIPDLLEQRIGRLDRIGQRRDIQIHVPYFEHTAQHVLFDWYHRGLGAFEKTCPTGTRVFEETQGALVEALHTPQNTAQLNALIENTHELNQMYKAQLDAGRDKLLEMNAAGSGKIEPLLDEIASQDASGDLPRFMNRLFDAFGVQQDEIERNCYVLMPTESMVSAIPGLDPEGMEVTYRRDTAASMEHLHFLSWDHPLVHNTMDAVITDVMGKASVAFIKDPELPKGAYYLQTIFVLSAQAPKQLQLGRYLPETPISVCIDAKGKPFEAEMGHLFNVNKSTANKLIGALKPAIMQNLDVAERSAHQRANQIQHDALERMHRLLGDEVNRLVALSAHNPSIREEEIHFLREQIRQLDGSMQTAQLQLDAVRLVVNNP
ncbi:RNA polymerase-associated protein RapA [Alteromonas oceanisediminis]|uniref:RNA polymerase-associated protein RapA n=1 Tax=Alteromonas oceanisediminis TaxID=2836180 RepID=UPI001BD97969|nr:RNA polymerase-associated protein RapA [Alteromonas oceanisediminis]MBT0585366.1 RNA polymerase-associated protein RapA [Alteromonas oceanisediminis]